MRKGLRIFVIVTDVITLFGLLLMALEGESDFYTLWTGASAIVTIYLLTGKDEKENDER